MSELIKLVQHGDKSAVARLLRRPGTDLDKQERGMTALLWAVELGYGDIADLLVQAGSNPNIPDEEGEMPLHVAAARCMHGLVLKLLHAGADPQARTLEGKTPLMDAAQAGCTEALVALLDAGADESAADEAHRTALHWATLGNHDDPKVARMLISRGVNIARANVAGMTAHDYAQARQRHAIAKAIEAADLP